MNLKIVTWNMDYWKRNKEARREAWSYLQDSIAPDLALLQECLPPEGGGYPNSVFRAFGGKMVWGCGVFSPSYELEHVDIETASPETVVGVSVNLPEESALPDGVTLTAVSLYGDIDAAGRAAPNLHRVFSELTPLLLGDLGKRWVIIAGDFNTSRQWEEGGRKWPGLSPSILFDRIEDFGLVECTAEFYEGHVQTYRPTRGDYPWQNDYIYVSRPLAERLTNSEVLDNDRVRKLSDHNPVVAEFDV